MSIYLKVTRLNGYKEIWIEKPSKGNFNRKSKRSGPIKDNRFNRLGKRLNKQVKNIIHPLINRKSFPNYKKKSLQKKRL